MTLNDVFVWVRPAELVKTHCSNYNSVFDFVFVSKDAQQWGGISEIMFSEATYCPDNNDKSDHRPVKAVFNLEINNNTKQLLIQNISRLQQELDNLKQLVDSLPQD